MRSGAHVARHIGRPLTAGVRRRWQKRGLRHRLFDGAAVGAIVVLLGVSVWALLNADPGRRVEFTAVVAPSRIISGDSSTLSISYTNRSRKTLTDATLTLAYPSYFVLQDVDHPTFEPTTNTIAMDDLPPGANGLIKIRGVMFGDVGGEQRFESTLAYAWDRGKGTQSRTYAFSPAASALSVSTDLPNRLVAGQRLSGSVTLTNTGPVTFPEAAIRAQFPDGFTLLATSLPQRRDTTWIVPSLTPGETLAISYSGVLALKTDVSTAIAFEPSFVFGDERFAQDKLEEVVTVIPVPFTMSAAVAGEVRANAVPVRIQWSNQTDAALSDIVISVEGGANTPVWRPDVPLLTATHDVTIIPQASGVHRMARIVPVAEFTLDDGPDRIVIEGAATEVRLPSDVRLSAFARYFTSTGDQLGRGPLPPRADDDTIYWAFLQVTGVQNALTGARVTAVLPHTVAWTDKQSVTFGAPVVYEPATRRLTWSLGDIAPENGARTLAASIAVALTPTQEQRGTVPALLTDIQFFSHDAWVNGEVDARAPVVTTRIAEDAGRVQ